MIQKPEEWDEIWGVEGTRVSYYVRIELFEDVYLYYWPDKIAGGGFSVENQLFSDYSFGNASSSMLTFKLLDLTNVGALQKNQRVEFHLEALNEDIDAFDVKLGTYYISTVTINDDETASVVAYDSMFILGQANPNLSYTADNMAFRTYAMALVSYYQGHQGQNHDIYYATMVDLLFDGDTTLASGFANLTGVKDTQIPGSVISKKSVREVCANVAAMNFLNLFVDHYGKLGYFCPRNRTTREATARGEIASAARASVNDSNSSITGVQIAASGKHISAPGWLVQANLPSEYEQFFSTDSANDYSNVARAIYAKWSNSTLRSIPSNPHNYNTQNVVFDGVEATGVLISPLVDIGDAASIDMGDGTYLNMIIHGYRFRFEDIGDGAYGDISARKSQNAVVMETTLYEPYGTNSFAFNYAPSMSVDGSYVVILDSTQAPTSSANISVAFLMNWPSTINVSYIATDDTTKTANIAIEPAQYYYPYVRNAGFKNVRFFTSNFPSDYKSNLTALSSDSILFYYY